MDLQKEYLAVRDAVKKGFAQKLSDFGKPAFQKAEVCRDGIIKKIEDTDPKIVELGLGKIGKGLVNFLSIADLEHPAICGLAIEALNEHADFSDKACEVIEHAKFAKEKGFKKVISLLKNAVNHHEDYKNLSTFFNFPPVRVLKGAKRRENRRKAKKWKPIEMKTLFKKGEDFWHSQANTLQVYPRFSEFYQKDIDVAKQRMDVMKGHGLKSLSEMFESQIEKVDNLKEQQYCGFYRIPMMQIAIVLARSLGFNFRQNKKIISISRDRFAKFPFWVEGMSGIYSKYEEGGEGEYWRGSSSSKRKPKFYREFNFSPRAYPLHQFKVEQPDHIREIISSAEGFHDMADKPIFDHFWVICPGIDYPRHTYEDNYCIRSGSEVKKFKKRDDALNALDFEMTKVGLFNPVLLGEMGGVCYFLSYWN